MLNWFISKWEILKSYLTAPFTWISWFFTEYLPTKVFQLLDSIGTKIDELSVSLSPSSIGIDLGLLNAFFPLAEFGGMITFLMSLYGVVQLVKWTLKLIPTMG